MSEADGIGRGGILVVDDNPENLRVVSGILQADGHRVRPVLSGRMALQAAAGEPPELFLLDVNMPPPDGYEVCACLKSSPALREIPVIFLSALDATSDKVRAFAAGAVDYVTKPFQAEEVLARVRTHLTLSRQSRELKNCYERLYGTEAMRDSLLRTIVGDMRSPLTTLALGSRMMARLVGSDPATHVGRCVSMMESACASMNRIVDSLLDVTRLEAGEIRLEPGPCELQEMAAQVVREVLPPEGTVRGTVALGGQPVRLEADHRLVRKVMRTLLVNALERSCALAPVLVETRLQGDAARVSLVDEGPPIPPALQEMLFSLVRPHDEDARRAARGAWLELAFCRLAVEAHGGSIGVRSRPGRGCEFWFQVPLRPTQAQAGEPRGDASAAERSASAPARARTVLVIDGDAPARRITEAILAEAGYLVTGVASGEEGCERALRVLPDAVVVEVCLVDLEGGEVAHRLESHPRTRHIPTIFLTDLMGEQDVVGALPVGRWHCLAKSARSSTLLPLLRSLLEGA